MAINNFLIVGIAPTNNETLVATNTEIVINFAKYMKEESLETITLLDSESNEVPVTREYDGTTMSLTLKPTSNLLEETVYTVFVKGTISGILSLNNDYLGYDKQYTFTTRKEVSLEAPSSFVVTSQNQFLMLNWIAPTATEPVTYSFVVSTVDEEVTDTLTSNILNNKIYPENDLVFSGSSYDIPKIFNEGTYYVYLQASTASTRSVYTKASVIVEAQTNAPTEPEDNIFGDFDILNTYPNNGEVNITPEEVIIMFSDKVDFRTIDSNSIYLLNIANKNNLTELDYMTRFSSSKQIESELIFETSPASNIVKVKAEFEKDNNYTVVVKKDIKSVNGQSFGIDYSFGFISEYQYLYGSLDLIKNDLSNFSVKVSDETILKYMNENSVYAHEIVSKSNGYNASDYEDGKAPYYVHQFVRYKTDYDLILGIIAKEASGVGKSITLGDLQVSKDDTISSMYDILDYFLKMLKGFEDELTGESARGNARAVMVVRGEDSADGAYPDFMDREEFKELGE